MDIFPLTIFPEGGLAGSIITTVWVGVFVMCFFNLRFGWVLSGLVVPGYLVPLLIVRPFAALVIGIEAVLAYLIVWVFSEKLAPGRYPALFGRDRFMGLILASITIRLAFDGYVLPEFADWLETNFDRRIDWESSLQSFGLVIVALMANQFWKPGLVRGAVMSGVGIGLTYLIVRYGLMEFTNFRISGVYYMYEGLSNSILASPKSYIILTLTALIASHYNVKYGWDFSGILIPALIALQWYQPTKILTSFGEAIIIYCVARLILKLPIMANVTLEGGRKLLLFFNVSFAWKMLLGWYVVAQGLDVKTTDFFGFGYLLSTLIAIKAHDKDIFPRIARSTLQVSVAGAVLGNLGGFAVSATIARTPWANSGESTRPTGELGASRLNSLVVNAVGDAHVRRASRATPMLSAEAEEGLAQLVELLDRGIDDVAVEFDRAASNWRIRTVEGGRLAIVRDDGRGAELLVYNPSASRNQAIIVPDPAAANGMAVAALLIQQTQDARWLVFSSPAYGAEIRQRSVAEIFEEATRTSHVEIALAEPGNASTLSLANGAGKAVSVGNLRQVVSDIGLTLSEEKRSASGVDATIMLSKDAIGDMAQRIALVGALQAGGQCRISKVPSEAGKARSIEQLAYARFEIGEPLVRQAEAGKVPVVASAAARLADMILDRCTIGNKPHWRLTSRVRDEGSIFLGEGEAPTRAVLAFENDRSALPARIGMAVHRQWQSDALFVATRSDSFLRDPRTILDVTWQAWVRRQADRDDAVVFQLRARPREAVGYRRGVDVLLAKDRLGPDSDEFRTLVSVLRQAGLRPELVTNSRDQAGMEARPGMSMRYVEANDSARYMFGWLMFPGIGERVP